MNKTSFISALIIFSLISAVRIINENRIKKEQKDKEIQKTFLQDVEIPKFKNVFVPSTPEKQEENIVK